MKTHSFDVTTRRCCFCGCDEDIAFDQRSPECHGELKSFRETLVISRTGVAWVRRALNRQAKAPAVNGITFYKTDKARRAATRARYNKAQVATDLLSLRIAGILSRKPT